MRRSGSEKRPQRSVTTLLEGRTPVKSRSYVSDEPASRVARKTVTTTIDGMTPKKERYYYREEAPSMTMPVSPWTKPTTSSSEAIAATSPTFSSSPSSSSSPLSYQPSPLDFDPFSSTKRSDFNMTQRSDFFQDDADDDPMDFDAILPTPPDRNISTIKPYAAHPPLADPGSPPEDQRPKTSRREPNPSPEKFADYVIPTPEKQNGEESFNEAAPVMFAIYLLGLTI